MLLVQALARFLQPANKPQPAAPKPLNLSLKACTFLHMWDPPGLRGCPQQNEFGASSLGAMDLALPLLLSSQTRAGAGD